MRIQLPSVALLSIGLMSGRIMAQSASGSQLAALCELQAKMAQGESRNVRVEGVHLAGLEGEYLVDAGCSSSTTMIEFELKTRRNWKKLERLVNKPYEKRQVLGGGEPVLVIFEGVFYGPPVPDPKLPEAIRKIYHPGWDSNSTTKLVVDAILSVKPLPADNPCAPPKSSPTQWPCFQHAPMSQKKNTE